jgi:single-strand DNA-binding protein
LQSLSPHQNLELLPIKKEGRIVANETILTIIGNTTGPAELRFTPSGSAVATFTVASAPRTFDKNSNAWVDGETLFLRCSAWREMAENVAETLGEKGVRVIVQGRLKQRSYEDKKTQEKRTVIELEVDEIGPSLKYANAKVNRTARSGSNRPGGTEARTPAPAQDPWAAPTQNADGWGNGPTVNQTEAPF